MGKDKLLRARLIGGLIFGFAGTQEAACMEHQVGGKTVEEVFTDSQLARLARAACDGNAAEVERTVRSGVDPNRRGYEGTTPLMWALTCEDLAGMEALLRSGADPNQYLSRISPVLAASTKENPEPLRLLLRYGGDPNARENEGSRTALVEGLSLGMHTNRWDNYYALLNAGADINRVDEMGNTIATAAVDFGQFDKVEELLQRGYNHDLPGLLRDMRSREVGSEYPAVAAVRDRLIRMLQERGVREAPPG